MYNLSPCNLIMHKFSPPGGESCDVTGQLLGARCTDHTQTVCGLGHRLVFTIHNDFYSSLSIDHNQLIMDKV